MLNFLNFLLLLYCAAKLGAPVTTILTGIGVLLFIAFLIRLCPEQR